MSEVVVEEQSSLNLAEKLYESNPYFYDEAGLFWLWHDGNKVYRICDEVALFNVFHDIGLDKEWLAQDGRQKSTTQPGYKSELIEAFRRVGRRHKPDSLPSSWIQFNDKLIDLDTGTEGTGIWDWFSTNTIPWTPSDSEDTPVMDRIFEQWVGPELVPMLYEIIAYCMLPQYPIHRIFCLNGSGSNGKSKFQELLMKFIGKDNCCATDLDLLISNRFEIAKLYRKLVCNMGETNLNALSKTQVIKRLTGQDLMTFEFKFKNGITGLNCAKLIVNTNSLPQTFDKTDGFFRRWVIVDFPNQFQETEDVLARIPDNEYNNLARKCIRILRELLQRRAFTDEGTIEQRRQRYEEASNPLKKFISLYYMEDVNSRTPYGPFRERFMTFLRENKRRMLTAKELTNALKHEGFDTKTFTTGKGDEKTSRVYILGVEEKSIDNTDSQTDYKQEDGGYDWNRHYEGCADE